MNGFDTITGDESIVYADNASFNGTKRGGKMVSDGQLWIGSTAAPHVRLGNITSDGTVIIENNAGNIELSVNPVASFGVTNIGFSYNGGTGVFTILADEGSNLSPTNPGFVTLQNKSAFGQLITIPVIANQSFIDDVGASEIIGNLFGLTTGIAVTVDIPFYLYAVVNDAMNAIQFMISRFPNAVTSPVSAKIGTPGNAVADTQGSFWSLDNVTATDYDQNPCLCIGSFRMRMSASDDWTVQALAGRDGIGHFQQGLQFTFPRGQFGSATGKVFKNNGGTAPDDADGGFTYYIEQADNRINWQLAFPAIDTAGVGSVNAQLAMAFNRLEGATNGSGFLNTGGNINGLFSFNQPTSNTTEFTFVNPTATGFLQNVNIGLTSALALNGSLNIEFS